MCISTWKYAQSNREDEPSCCYRTSVNRWGFFLTFLESYLSKKGHSEVCAQQSLASMHHLHHFSVGTVEGIIQVCQFLFDKCVKQVEVRKSFEMSKIIELERGI